MNSPKHAVHVQPERVTRRMSVSTRRRALTGIVVLLLAACTPAPQGSTTPTSVEVQSVAPVRRIFHAQVTAFGQLAADSRTAASLSLPQAGQIVAIEVIAGQRVRRGAPLLTLKTNPATRSAWLQARSALAAARSDLASIEALHATRLATNAQVNGARKTLTDAQAAFDAQTKLGGAAAMTTLSAPADGVITTLDVQRGQRVAAGTPLIEFTPQAALAAQLGVQPGAAAGIRDGMAVILRSVYAQPGAAPLRGTVVRVGDAINPQSDLVDVTATLDAPVALAAGSALSARINTSTFTAWAVPRNALQNDAHGRHIFQIENGKARRVAVKVLAPDGSPIGVEGALDPNAPVITLGSYEVSDGEAVTSASGAQPETRGTAAR